MHEETRRATNPKFLVNITPPPPPQHLLFTYVEEKNVFKTLREGGGG